MATPPNGDDRGRYEVFLAQEIEGLRARRQKTEDLLGKGKSRAERETIRAEGAELTGLMVDDLRKKVDEALERGELFLEFFARYKAREAAGEANVITHLARSRPHQADTAKFIWEETQRLEAERDALLRGVSWLRRRSVRRKYDEAIMRLLVEVQREMDGAIQQGATFEEWFAGYTRRHLQPLDSD